MKYNYGAIIQYLNTNQNVRYRDLTHLGDNVANSLWNLVMRGDVIMHEQQMEDGVERRYSVN